MMPDSLERKEEEHLRSLLARVSVLSQRELTIEPLGGGLTNRNYLASAAAGTAWEASMALKG